MLEDDFGNFQGSVKNSLPNGAGIKIYKTGHSIEGTWVQGRPEGRVFLSSPPEYLPVTFKNGYFKYFGESIKGICFEKGHGYGIYFNETEVYAGFFDNGLLGGPGYIVYGDYLILKGNLYEYSISGPGTLKRLIMNQKIKGNFKKNFQHGKCDVYFDEFRIEAFYDNGRLINPVKYYKNERFIAELRAEDRTFIPLDKDLLPKDLADYSRKVNEKMIEFIKFLKQRHGNNFAKKNIENSLIDEMYLNGFYEINLDLFWLTYEIIKLERTASQVKSDVNDDIMRKNDNKDKWRPNNVSFEFETYYYPSGDKYIGSFKEGKRNGLGVYLKQGSVFYKGYWKNDFFDGKGNLFLGKVKITAIWVMGVPKGPVKVLELE